MDNYRKYGYDGKDGVLDMVSDSKRISLLQLRRNFGAIDKYFNKTILIEIPSFKDPELLNTVYSAVIQADFPERVHFAVCYQDDDMNTLAKLYGVNHMRVAHVLPEGARGTCYARYLAQELYDGEDFAFHIDSHMRFIKHWDTELIHQWYACNDDKAIISFYPYGCKHEWCTLKLDDPIFDNPYIGGRIGVRMVDDKHWRVAFSQKMYIKNRIGAVIRDRSPFVAGGYAFMPGRVSVDVKMDPYMWYQGDEFAYGIRLFTHGYNVYNTEDSYVLHKYSRPERVVPPMNDRRLREYARLSVLMGLTNDIDLGEFGVGKVRTIEEYQEFSGLNFATKFISDKAREGRYGFNPILKEVQDA